MTLYDVLQVSKTASAEEIKSAHRRRAKEAHPDIGGDREAFQRVQHAWHILGDPARRRAYDETGEEGAAVPSELPPGLEVLAGAFTQVISEAPFGIDVVSVTRSILKEGRDNADKERRNHLRTVEGLKLTAKALQEKSKERILGNLIAGQIEKLEGKIAICLRQVAEFDAAIALIKGATCELSDADQAAAIQSMVALLGAMADKPPGAPKERTPPRRPSMADEEFYRQFGHWPWDPRSRYNPFGGFGA